MFCGAALPHNEHGDGGGGERFQTDPQTGMEFVRVPRGSFRMGNIWDDGKPDEQPVHLVEVAAFQLARFPVTQAQWQAVMGDNPATASGELFVGDHKPVVNVSWDDALEFIARLNTTGGVLYRLPSEAEWEFAARAGGKDQKWSGTSEEKLLPDYAWYSTNSQGRPQPVGTKLANGLGLHDMSGNVWEWCQDVWHPNYEGAPADASPWLTTEPDGLSGPGTPGTPGGPGTPPSPSANNNPSTAGLDQRRRVMRGGSWNFNASNARTTYRDWNTTDYRFFVVGLRLAR